MWKRFKSLRRGYISFLILVGLLILSCFLEVLVHSRALFVNYQGKWFFPTYSHVIPGTQFNLEYEYETNYKELKKKFEENPSLGFVLMPIIPFDAFETDLKDGTYPPYAPSAVDQHYLGTDQVGRDILARLAYGFRLAMMFALVVLVAEYFIGISLGIAMGYFGGPFDLILQRFIEIWSNLPFLYVIMILSSLTTQSFSTLAIVMVFFSWINMTWYMRTAAYKEKARDYIAAAKVMGASHTRIIFKHILPNTISIVVTFIPFTISGSIVSLTSLDFLGFGLPPPTPSWGELLAQGTANLDAYWIVTSVVTAMICILIMVTFMGEAVRECFDPKKLTTYR